MPITGSGPSLRGAEVALALAKAVSAPITALAIASASAKSACEGRHARGDNTKILREVTLLAKYFDVKVLRRVGKGNTQQASRRSLSFGPLAAGLLDRSAHTLLLISS